MINRDDIKNIISDYVEKTYKLEDEYETPAEFKILTKSWVKFLCYFTFFLLFIPVIWYRIKMTKYKAYMDNLINVSIDIKNYHTIIKQIKSFDGVGIVREKPHPLLVKIRNQAVASFPWNHRIDKETWSDIYGIKVFKKYQIKTQHVLINYHYYVETQNEKGESVTETYYDSWSYSMATFNTNAFMDKDGFILNINNSRREGNKFKLENPQFNKRHLVYTNNKTKTNMLLTILYQEIAVNNKFKLRMSMHDNLIYAFNHKFEVLYTAGVFPFKISDINKGKEHMYQIICKTLEQNINTLIDAFEPYLILPVW